ncbi:IS200/IS605 family element transposase accessory protein TnpB [Pseudanabaena sp. FACHB-1277]|jgi:putative transposase|uniref:IS200/IS605 family element transposase accessory protein TnpB n=1 Tax=Pseudanabaena cinerea FACHB-1277 TaxID=2949581 RepID=A0A926UQ16_9CYAN|nr:RNA-guided endonuclease TnpB family protein [Pseudanabaena cinerea]MBD2148733.1 IS200/IS605 family element transposase accessory protein TnpB [Pseudanabaena cinerea FACHB-1277]
MLVLEAKLKGKTEQYNLIDEAIRTALFCRNKALRFWIDNRGADRYDLNKFMAVLAKDFDFANKLNSQARQSSAERAWSGIARFFDNCKKKVSGKKGYPKFKKRGHSVEYKTTGWKLSEDRKYLTLTDGFKIGRLKLVGSRDLNFYQIEQIKRVRLVKRADGYYAQFCVDVDRREDIEPTQTTIGLDVGLNHFYTDSKGKVVENPKFLRKSERQLKKLQRKVSKRKKGSANRRKAIKRLAKKHLQVIRQRKDFAVKTARCVVRSNDLIAYEDLQVRNMVKNHKLAKSISDASWSMFRDWVEYFGKVFGKVTVAVPPQYTSQNCSNCGTTVKKSLSERSHQCSHCGTVLDRDHNAALNILAIGLNRVGHTQISTPVESSTSAI